MNEETEDLKNMIIHLVGLAEEHCNEMWFKEVDNAGTEIMNRLDKLQAFKDKQEQGLLISLPCKVGDYAWDLIAHYRFEITSIVINSCGTIFFKCGNKGTEDYASFSIEDIGDTWMITEPKESDYWNPRSEAEEALAKMGE